MNAFLQQHPMVCTFSLCAAIGLPLCVWAIDTEPAEGTKAPVTSVCLDGERTAHAFRREYGAQLGELDRSLLGNFFEAMPGYLCVRRHLLEMDLMLLQGERGAEGSATQERRQVAVAMRNLLTLLAKGTWMGDEEGWGRAVMLAQLADVGSLCLLAGHGLKSGALSHEDVFGKKSFLWRFLELPGGGTVLQPDEPLEASFADTFRSFGLYALYFAMESTDNAMESIDKRFSENRALVTHMVRVDPGQALKVYLWTTQLRSAADEQQSSSDGLDDVREVVDAAVYFKGEGPIGRPALQEALKLLRPLTDPEKTPGWFLRLYAAEVLAQNPVLDDAEGFRRQALQRLRNDPDPSVRLAAERGLKTLQ